MNRSLAHLYSYAIGLAGLGLVASLSDRSLLAQSLPLLSFAGLSLVIKRFGFHVFDETLPRSVLWGAGRMVRARPQPPGEVTHSLVGVIDLSALLLYGPIFGAWAAMLSEFTYLMLRRPRWTWGTPERWETAVFNTGLKALMALAGGLVYVNLGGVYHPVHLAIGLLLPLAGLFLTWFGIDHLGWSVRVGLGTGRAGAASFLRTILLSSVLVELVPLPMSVALAVVYASLGWPIFGLLAGGFVVTGFIIQRLVDARRRLRAQLNQLDAISQVSRQVAAIPNLEDLFDRVVQLIQQRFGYARVQIYTRDDEDTVVFRASSDPGGSRGHRGEPQPLPADGSIVGWVAAHGQPLLINDLSKEPRHAFHNSAMLAATQAELAIPLKVEERVLGVLDVQNSLPGTFDGDDLSVLQTLADQVAIAIEDAGLNEQLLERERLERELGVAREMQASLLPAACPLIPGWDIAATWQPARTVAGDFYDFIHLRDARWGVLIADVSDKGVPAALFMAVARTLLRAMAIGKEEPAAALQRANDLILADTRTDMFVTVFYAVLDPVAAEITYVNAGHVPPLLYRRQAGSIAMLRTRGIALGVVPDIQLEQHIVPMMPGDLIVLYTDGITEAVNDAFQDFGEERLARLIFDHHGATAGDLITVIENALLDFVGDQPPFDDRALLVLKRVGEAAVES